ncbi:MAG: hypothetical protein U9P10_07040 [Thermodesulfobacteriota bacterium]|nr:hypothetical protein [Thermodesulfobacteriota bacterium]MEA2060253.1 hypothetical protein [Thermodesulfobacteriota bacterium]
MLRLLVNFVHALPITTITQACPPKLRDAYLDHDPLADADMGVLIRGRCNHNNLN